jgi:hypothetical protein
MDMTKLTVAFCNFVNVPKNMTISSAVMDYVLLFSLAQN